MCERSLEKRDRSEYHEMDGVFFCRKSYLYRKRPRRSSSDNEVSASVDETDTRSQSVFGCERRVLRQPSTKECLEILIQIINVYVPYDTLNTFNAFRPVC